MNNNGESYQYPRSTRQELLDESRQSTLDYTDLDSPDILHYGRGHASGGHSGRYPWGSGDKRIHFTEAVAALKESGITDKTKQAKELGISRNELQAHLSSEHAAIREEFTKRGRDLVGNGKSVNQAANELGVPEATLRSYLNNTAPSTHQARLTRAKQVTDMYRKALEEQSGYIDVGAGTEHQIGITKYQKDMALEALKQDGYYVHKVLLRNLTNPDKPISTQVLTKNPDQYDVQGKHALDVQLPNYQYEGVKLTGISKPVDVPWKDVSINYGINGENDRDGTILVRRGNPEADLGASHYAQVRISVGGTHYMKGMAMYGDDDDFKGLPSNVKYIFHTNKPSTKSPQDVLKKQKDNPLNPFESSIRHQKGVFNIVNQEGDWSDYRTTLASQFLSKQNVSFVKERLKDTFKRDKEDYDSIVAITNPVVKQKLLQDLVGDPKDKTKRGSIDTEQFHMRAVGEPGTRYKTLIANPWLKANEVYAPDYNDGDHVVLVRYPHGGTFELPDLVVNNKAPKSKKLLGNAIDGIGIHPEAAHKLSGADFDGDTVIVLPNNSGKIKYRKSLPGLKNFDPNDYELTDPKDLPYETTRKNRYTGKEEKVTVYPGKHISPRGKQTEMGNVSNLITDMTIKGASDTELARAVKYSMVVIDSEKHHLDYKAAADAYGIKSLRKKYMTKINPDTGRKSLGANTLISVAKHEQTKGEGKGTLINTLAKQGRLDKINSGSPVENAYQNYIEQLQVIKNNGQKELSTIDIPKRDPYAAKAYSHEVLSLNSKIKSISAQAPLERKAQVEANQAFKEYIEANPTVSTDRKKSLRSEMLNNARLSNGVTPYEKKVHITPKEWDAIQANAISKTALEKLLSKADMDELRSYATPKSKQAISPAKLSSIKRMMASNNYTLAEIAQSTGLSPNTIKSALAADASK